MYSGTLERYHDFVQRVLQRHQWRSHMPRGSSNLPSLKVFLAERASDNNTEGSCGIPVKNSKVERLTLNLCRMRGSTICQLIQGTQALRRFRHRCSGLVRMDLSLSSSCLEEFTAHDDSMAQKDYQRQDRNSIPTHYFNDALKLLHEAVGLISPSLSYEDTIPCIRNPEPKRSRETAVHFFLTAYDRLEL